MHLPLPRTLAGCTLAGCTLAFLLTALPGLGQDPQPKTSRPSMPDGLRHVPPDALGFVHLRVGDFLKSPQGATLMQTLRLDRETGKVLQKMEQMTGLALAELDSITVLMLAPPTSEVNLFPQRWNLRSRNSSYKGVPFTEKPVFDMPRREPVEKIFDEKKFPDRDRIEEKRSQARPAESAFSFVSFQDAYQKPNQGDLEIFLIQTEYMGFSGPLVIVTSKRPLDRKKLLRTLMEHAADSHHHGNSSGTGPAMLILSEHALLVGNPWEIGRYSELMARTPGPKAHPLQAALAPSEKRHLLTAAGALPPGIQRVFQNPQVMQHLRPITPVVPLLQTQAMLTLDLDKSVEVTLQFQARNEPSAALALEAVRSLRVLAQLGMEQARQSGEPGGWKLSLEKAVAQALADAVIEARGTTVQAQLKLEVDATLSQHLIKDLVSNVRLKEDRSRTTNNLKVIALAMHGYHDTNRFLPPAGISSINDPNGKPLLSWRVAILPYIDESNLYREFDLTLPWDHPHNKKLIGRMPKTYVVPGAETREPGLTHYRVLVGPGTMFEKRQGPGGRLVGWKLTEIVDGTSNTLMVVEAAEPTIWTRPEDLPYDPKGPLPKLGVSQEGFHAAFGDGSVHYLRSRTPEETLRALITRNGGEVVNVPD